MTDQEWIELLDNLEVQLLTDCEKFDFLSPDTHARIRTHLTEIKGDLCIVGLDYQELQWTGLITFDRNLFNPDSSYVKERLNEKSTSS